MLSWGDPGQAPVAAAVPSALAVPLSADMADGLVTDRVIDVARAQPDAIAVSDSRGSLTFGQLIVEASVVCAAVRRAVPDGRPVGILSSHDTGAVAAALGVVATGSPLVVLDPSVPAARLRRYTDSAGIAAIVADNGRAQLAAELSPVVIDPEAAFDRAGTPQWQEAVDELTSRRPRPADPLVVVYTSGSTGAPKGVICDHRSVLHDAWTNSVGTGCYAEGDRVAHLLPMAFSAGIGLTFATLLCGAEQHLFDPRARSVAELPLWLMENQIDVLVAGPSILRGLLNVIPHGEQLTGLRTVTMAGETVFGAELERLRSVLGPGCELRNRYGSTETWLIAEHIFTASAPALTGAAPVGRPVPGVVLQVQDESGARHTSGSGRVVVTSSWLSSGYRGRPDLTSEVFTDNPDGTRSYLTSDVGRLDDGVLTLLGRTDHSVKIRGQLVEPGEIDAVLHALPDVREAVVTGAVSPGSGRTRLVAYVVSEASRPQAPVIRAAVRASLPAYMVPEQVVFLDRLPRNERGKLDRAALPKPSEVVVGQEPPHSDWERVVMLVFARVLEFDRIGRDDDFFALGGDSLAAEALLAAMHAELGVADDALSTATLAQAPTPATFAAAVRLERTVVTGAVPLRDEGTSRPFFVVAGAGGIAIAFRGLAEAIDADVPVYALQAHGMETKGVPDWSIERMARRHLASIRMVQPHGPYRLGGHSFGGLVALEMAIQLREAGDEAELVVVIDSFPPNPEVMPDALWGSPVAKLRGMVAIAGAGILPVGEQGPYWRFHRQGIAMQRRYSPRAYSGRTLIVIAADDPDAENRQRWAAHLDGPWTMRPIPGDHTSILRAPHVAALAAVVNEALGGLAEARDDGSALHTF